MAKAYQLKVSSDGLCRASESLNIWARRVLPPENAPEAIAGLKQCRPASERFGRSAMTLVET